MTHAELIAKAKEHAQEFIKMLPVDPKVLEGDGKVRDAVIIYFGDSDDSLLQIILDKETGELISAEAPRDK